MMIKTTKKLFVGLAALSALSAIGTMYMVHSVKAEAMASIKQATADGIDAGFSMGQSWQLDSDVCERGIDKACAEASRVERERDCAKLHATERDVVERCGVMAFGPEPRP